MSRARIAVIVAGIDQSYQSAVLRGLQAGAISCGADLAVFVSFSGTMGNPHHDAGELNIFRLPEFSEYDGVILMTNTIDYPPVVQRIHDRVKESGIPAISIDNDVPEFLHIGIDNRKAMRRITEHFVKHHRFSRFAYISGPEDNTESIDRLEAFREVLQENGLSIDDDRIYYGDFRGPAGKAAIEKLLASGQPLPEAVICANDVMAASAVNALEEAGYSVPEDISVSGFDNTYSGHNFRIELTTVDRPLYRSGELACRMLCEKIGGKEPEERSVILEMHPRFAESCGCYDSGAGDISHIKELNYNNYSTIESMRTFTEYFNKLSSKLVGCNSFDQYIAELKLFIKAMDPKEFYFCLCENWDTETELYNYSDGGSRKNVPTEFTERAEVRIEYRDGEFRKERIIRSADVIPDWKDNGREGGNMYYVVPLHFGERCLGFMVLLNNKISLTNSMFQSWCITISNSLENIRKLLCLDYAVNRLEKLYAKDTFSGIYNRNGFVRATKGIYRQCIEQQRNIMLMFIDLDGLKKINDTYGHDMGDNAISGIAHVLRKVCTKNEVFCRFGGDEFIVFAADADEEYAADLIGRINARIKEINSSEDNPYELSASVGYVIAKPDEEADIFKFVTQADKKMYIDKRRKKRERDKMT